MGALEEKGNRTSRARENIMAFFGMISAWLRGRYRPRKRLYFVLIFSLLYFILPFDLISDLAPLVGITDDAVVLGILIKVFADEVQRFKAQFAEHDKPFTDTSSLPPGDRNPEG